MSVSSCVLGKRPVGITGGVAKAGTERNGKKVPRLVVGLGDSEFAARVAAEFRGLGWDVTTTAGGEEARRLAVRGKANAVIVRADSGLLDTAKLVNALPRRTRAVLVGAAANEELERVSSYLGACYVAEKAGVGALVKAVVGAETGA